MIHDIRVAHCDIKLGNIVFDERFNPVFIDFGESDIVDAEYGAPLLKYAGTPNYMPPEIQALRYT